MSTRMIGEVMTGKEEGVMKISEIVKIKGCSAMPEVVGERAEIVDLQIQELDKYTVYPVWVKITSGERQGKIYGFHYDEVEVLPEARPEGTVKTSVAEQLEEVLGRVIQLGERGGEKAPKVGGTVKISKCEPVPEVVGERAEIVGLHIQELDKYTVYPVWVKMTSGERQGKIYGFHYDEVEVLPEAHPEETTKIKVLEQLEETLGTMKTGGIVKIKKCDSLAELVGEGGKIVDLQIQEFDKYTVYPMWVQITSGERKGKIYGFNYDEVEILPKPQLEKTTRTKLDEQLEEILRCITTVDDIAEIERAIDKVKGNIRAEPAQGFWEEKTPCWEMLRCPEEIRNECPAFKHQDLPCWQMEGTYCKLHDNGLKGHNTDICRACRIYKRWGQDEPIEIKLLGKGFNQAMKEELK